MRFKFRFPTIFSKPVVIGLLTVCCFLPNAFGESLSPIEASSSQWKLISTPNSPQRESGSVFIIESQDTIGVFGGYSEALDVSDFTQPTENTFFNDILLFHTPTQTWTTQSVDNGLAPPPRGHSCTVYHESTHALYVFGGASYSANFNSFNYYDDQWKFDFNTNTWIELSTVAPSPSARAGTGCALVDDSIYLFSGGGENFSSDNELWRYDITNNTWNLLQANNPKEVNRPPARTQSNFARVLGEKKLLLNGGDALVEISEPPFVTAKTQEDVWTYDIDSNNWSRKKLKDKPSIPRNHQGFSFTSGRYFFVQNGDAQGRTTAKETCQSPLRCLLTATPTNDTFVYDLIEEKWEALPSVADDLPPTRRSMMGLLGDTLYLFGGYGWDGTHGNSSEGKIENENTWKLQLPPKYLS